MTKLFEKVSFYTEDLQVIKGEVVALTVRVTMMGTLDTVDVKTPDGMVNIVPRGGLLKEE